jgi:hypothetical protein
VPMALLPTTWGPLMFGAVCAAGFFVPGFKYYRQRQQNDAEDSFPRPGPAVPARTRSHPMARA